MNKGKSVTTVENQNTVSHSNSATEAYVKPTLEVIEMEMDAAVLISTQSGLPGSYAKTNNDLQNPFAGISEDLKA